MKGFILYTAQYEALKELTTEQKGQLLDLLFQYASTGTMPAMTDEAVRVAANFLRIQIDMDSGKYEKKCERNKEIALERERRRKEQRNSTNVHERTRTYTIMIIKMIIKMIMKIIMKMKIII